MGSLLLLPPPPDRRTDGLTDGTAEGAKWKMTFKFEREREGEMRKSL